MKKITGIILTLLFSCATFVSAQVTLSGATEATPGAINKSYATLQAAFSAINVTNTAALATDVLTLEVSANTTETGQATLNAPLGVSSLVLTPGATTYKFPQITLNGGTNTATGTFVVTIYNGKVTGIANSTGAWTVAPTSVTIEGTGGANSLNVTTQATAFCTTGGTNLSFNITNGGAGYGPKTTVTPTSGGSGAEVGLALISAATTPAAGVISPAASAVSSNVYLDIAGSGYVGGATAPATNVTGGTFAVGTEATASYAITITKANYASVKIYPTAPDLVIGASLSTNQPFITLMGTPNVTIDGRVHTAGVPSGAVNLTIQYNCTNASTNNAATIYLNVGAHHNTISYCKLKSATQNGNTRGTLAIGTNALSRTASESSVGGSYNTISFNEFSALNPNGLTGTNRGNGGMLTSANFNDDFPSTNNIFDNNRFDNFFINGPASNLSAAIYIFGNTNPNKPNHSNYTITNNSFFNSLDGATPASGSRMFIKVGNAPNGYGGFGHTISGNYIGGKAAQCTGGILTKTGAFLDNFVCIHFNGSYGAPSTIQNNVIKNISMTNGYTPPAPPAVPATAGNTTKFIDIFGYGNVSVTGNKIGDDGSITIDNSAMTIPSYLYGIYVNGVSADFGSVTCENNTIANITHNTTTGFLNGIFHEFGVNAFNANANLIHSLNVASTSTTVRVVGINCASGTNSITNNIVKLNGDNAATIYGLNEEETATSSSFLHNTVYISGTQVGALNSACIASNGSTNSRSIQNNVFVNARTNNSATDTGVHYALLMPAATGTIAVNANDYQATGAVGAMLGSYGGANVSTGSVIVTGQDATSMNMNPGFALAGGMLADNYKTSATLTGVSSSVTTDFSGATRSAIQMGAWNKSMGTAVNNLVENNAITVYRNANNQITVNNNQATAGTITVCNIMGQVMYSTAMNTAITTINKSLTSGVYLVMVNLNGKISSQKVMLR